MATLVQDDNDTVPRLPNPSNRMALLSLVLVFLGGAATGAVLMRVREHQVHVQAAAPSVFPATVEDWKKKLNLTDDQTHQITSILDDFSHYYDNVLADGKTRIVQVLNPEQRRIFEQMLRERRR